MSGSGEGRRAIQDVLHHWLGGPGKAFAVDDITDEIVDALGFERVGYISRLGNLHDCGGRKTEAHRGCEPVYRLGRPGGSDAS